MNVYIRDRQNGEPVARYEVHLVDGDRIPPDQRYFDEAWKLAQADGIVVSDRRRYEFQLQLPTNLYEASR